MVGAALGGSARWPYRGRHSEGAKHVLPRLIKAGGGLVAVVSIGLLATPGAAQGTVHVSTTTDATYYAIGKPACTLAEAGHATCFAVRRVEVKEGTPGARSYRLPAGAVSTDQARGGIRATIGPSGGLTPSDLATAYGFDSAAATSQKVAIIDVYNDPKIDADLQTFDSEYGLSACSTSNGCLQVVNQEGGSTLPPDDTSGWSVEDSLDVETVHSVCQGCKILLVEAGSSAISSLTAAVHEAVALRATEISNSYGWPEGAATPADEAAYDHPGIVITASAGDDGYYDFDLYGAVDQPDAPASFNTVVAVGGTSLLLNQTGARQSESVWNDNGTADYDERLMSNVEGELEPLGATGGGCSTMIPAKAWQTSLGVWASTGCGSHRLVSDISADADYLTGLDIYDSYACSGKSCTPAGWNTIGGTSLASPIIAAMFGLAGGSHGVSYPALTLYGHLGSPSLHDITSGGNGYCDGEGAAQCGDPNTLGIGAVDCDYPAAGADPTIGDRACDALPGYDGPTGVGTPKGLGAFAPTGPAAKIAGTTSIVHGVSGTWTASTTDPFPGGKVTSYSWGWGDGTTTVTTTGSASHHYADAGAHDTITLTVTDSFGERGRTTHAVAVT